MPMRFPFNEEKVAQAAAYLIVRHNGRLNYMVLIKLLYLADRKALIESGMPITGDQPVSMPHGPVLSVVLDLINMGREDGSAVWYDYISEPINYNVALIEQEPSRDELSDYELSILESIDDRFGGLDKWGLRDLTHSLPEWSDPHGSSVPIRFEDILQAANKSPDEIERIASDAQELQFFKALEG